MRISSFAYDNAAPVPAADLVIIASDPGAGGAAESPIPLRGIGITGSFGGAIASLVVTHRFALPAPEAGRTGATLDARYRFPIPGDGAVRGVTMRFGDEEVRAELKERGVARDTYEHARAQGKAAVLVSDSGQGVLTLEVTGLTPGIPLEVETELVVMPRLEPDGASTLRIPLTSGPRYSRQDEQPLAAEANPLAAALAVPYRATLALRVGAGLTVTSPTHNVRLAEEAGGLVLRLDGDVAPDRDIVLVARPATAAPTLTGSVLLGETEGERTPWLATIVAPAAAAAEATLPRSLVLLLDRSGSMGGSKWAATAWAARSLVAGMRDEDWLTVVAFDDQLERSAPGLVAMDAAARRSTAEWIRGIGARGGTELGAALEDTLKITPRPGTQAELLLVTDGEVTDSARILSVIAGSPWRVSVLCIDAAPNSRLVQTIAARGGGESWFLGSTGDVEEITDAVDRVTALFGAPSVGDLVLHAPAPGSALGRRAGTGVPHTGDALAISAGAMPAGAVRVVAGWTSAAPTGFRVTGSGTDVALTAAATRESGVNALVAAAEIAIIDEARAAAYTDATGELAREIASGAGIDPARLPKGSTYKGVPGTRSADPLDEALRTIMVERSLAARVISSATAFVGVRSKAGTVTSGAVDVPSALPAGWDPSFAGGAPLAYAPSPASAMPPMASMAFYDAAGPGSPSIPTPQARHRRIAAKGFDSGTSRLAPASHKLDLDVASLRRGIAVAAPTGTWSVLRASGLADASTASLAGVVLILWSADRTRPLVRVRLTDLLAAGDRPMALRFGPGETLNFALEGGLLGAGTLHLELGEGS